MKNLRDTSFKFLTTASEALQMPMDTFVKPWSEGEDVLIPANTHLGVDSLYPSHGLFIHSGIIRDYFIDDKGVEHTIQFAKKYSMIAPRLTNLKSNGDIKILSETLTPVEARIWKLSFMRQQAEQNPTLFRSVISLVCEAGFIKQRNDIRLNACTAKERYLLFLDEFPGFVNQVPLKYISSYLKMTPETTSRIRTELSK